MIQTQTSLQRLSGTRGLELCEFEGADLNFDEMVVGNFMRLAASQPLPGQVAGTRAATLQSVFENGAFILIYKEIAQYLSVRDLLRLIRAMKSPELEHRLHIELLVRHNCTHSRFPTQAGYKRSVISLCDSWFYPKPKKWLKWHFTKAGQAWVYQNPLREMALSHHLRNPQKRVFPVRIFNRQEDYHWWVNCVIELRDGRLVSGAGNDYLMRVWMLSDPSRARCEILDGFVRGIICLAELPDGRIVSGTKKRFLVIWDLNQPDGKKQVGTKLCSSWLCDIAVLSDGRLAVASGFNNLEVLT